MLIFLCTVSYNSLRKGFEDRLDESTCRETTEFHSLLIKHLKISVRPQGNYEFKQNVFPINEFASTETDTFTKSNFVSMKSSSDQTTDTYSLVLAKCWDLLYFLKELKAISSKRMLTLCSSNITLLSDASLCRSIVFLQSASLIFLRYETRRIFAPRRRAWFAKKSSIWDEYGLINPANEWLIRQRFGAEFCMHA